MNNITFTYNAESALAAGKSGFITESGAYVVTIQEAKYVTSSGGAESIEFSVEADDGKKANYLNVYCKKKDGTPNQYGINMIHAIMGCADVGQLTTKMINVHTHIAPELTNKRVGLVLQKTLKTKTNGQDTYSFEIILPFIAQTRQTLDEQFNGLPAQTIDKKIATLQDKDERKHAPVGYQQYQSEYPGDDIFFNN
ncbi:DUF669 domain-containing protein [Arsenophonus sp. ENCA]|uniref:DUF669 domain-containing protein n=1 Tax=Arsenophonus sp. ENCA TaxID=1987579 RepID=UPI000BC4B5E1|nr:DUF669 domain-containing protein [Arsenophonus sp. ENCA]PAV02379.1 DUF669 domain-containing protein [Arsenophonus sp. ENCA]